MITFSKFERHGNLGNQLFQYAAILGMSYKYNTVANIPRWKWASYFKNNPHIIDIPQATVRIEEPHFHYCPQAFDNVDYGSNVVDVLGWFQTEKYWVDYKPKILEQLSFKQSIIDDLKGRYSAVFAKKTICISIRRGDYVDNPNYAQLPISYYYLAMLEHFPDWQNCNILIFSDDLPYCKRHFECLDNCYFTDGLNPMEQLVLGSQCDNFIISNSTFSWWMAYLGQKKHSKVIRPNYHFDGELKRTLSTVDYHPYHWITFDHKDQKLDMKDVTFIIPVAFDSADRRQNLELSVCMIQKYLDTNIIIGEQGSDYFKYMEQWCKYVKFPYPKFHRTKMLNMMTMMAGTPIVVNFDADILVPPMQMYLAVEKLRDKEADFVYPFDGQFARVPRVPWFATMEKYTDIGMFRDTGFKGTWAANCMESFGGVIAYNKEAFIKAGGENEKMISYAPEDFERVERFRKLGFSVHRVKSMVYHIDHQLAINSSTTHSDYNENENEFERIKKMTADELRSYVSTWHYFQNQ